MNPFEQALLRYFSQEQLAKIQAVTIGIAGAGGLGSNCAVNLVRCGFKHFVICDYDVVEHSNLNRQFYFLSQAGMPKTAALKENLLRINPDLTMHAQQIRLTEANIRSVFTGCDAIVEAFDTADCKSMIAEAYMRSGIFFVSASGIAGWGNSDAIRVQKMHGAFHLIGDLVTGVSPQTPPCCPRVSIAAAKQADVILAWALERTP